MNQPVYQKELILQGWGNSPWLWFIVLVSVASVVLVVMLLRYERQLVSKKVGVTLLTLRLVTVAILFLTFLQPVLSWSLDKEKSGRIVIAIDVSQSMETIDTFASKAELLRWGRAMGMLGNDKTKDRLDSWIAAYERGEEPQWVSANEAQSQQRRAELAKLRKKNIEDVAEEIRKLTRKQVAMRLITGQNKKLIESLEEIGVVEIRAFATKPELLDVKTLKAYIEKPSPASIVPQQTDLTASLASIGTDSESALVGVIVLSDGRHNAGQDPIHMAARLGTLKSPVIAVMIGSERRPKDLAVVAIECPQVAFRDDTPVLIAKIACDGFNEQDVTVILEKPDGERETKTIAVPRAGMGNSLLEVKFELDASELGRQEYTVRMDVQPEETRDDNNERPFAIQIVDDKSRVLLVEGEARWEFRFVDNALERDERVDLQHVVFDQPFIGVLPTTFFPKKLELPDDDKEKDTPFARLDMMIVGDVAPEDVDDNMWNTIERWVSEEGGTLVMLAGKNNFPDLHRGAAVSQLLPIENSRTQNMTGAASEDSPRNRGFRLRLTPDGESLSMFKFDTDTVENRAIWNSLPGHLWGKLAKARPAASVLATARGVDIDNVQDERENAVIVHQHFGFGQVLWIGIDSTWRWRFRVGDKYHHRFWGQMARWAAQNKATAGNKNVRLQMTKSQMALGEVAVVRARWQKPFLLKNPNVKGFINIYREPDDGTGRPFARLELKPNERNAQIHETRISGLPSGAWRVELAAENADIGDPVESTLYVHEPLTSELSDLSANRNLLSLMAEVSQGKLLMPDETDQIVNILKPPTSSTQKLQETTLWDHWIFMVIFFGLLTTEWITRKLNGLP
jgi:hypothetical protein